MTRGLLPRTIWDRVFASPEQLFRTSILGGITAVPTVADPRMLGRRGADMLVSGTVTRERLLRALWVLAFVSFVALLIVEKIHDPDPSIVNLEMAGRAAKAQSILDAWGDQLGMARASIRYDYPFIACYVVTIAGLCLFGGRRPSHPGVSRTAFIAMWSIVVAGLIDVLEDVGISSMIDSDSGHLAPWVKTLAAGKFLLFLAALGCGIALGVARGVRAADERIERDRAEIDSVSPGVEEMQVRLGPQRPNAPVPRPRAPARLLILRWLVGLTLVPPFAPPKPAAGRPGVTGICCSGGGIRSAAYNLGALQVLQEEQVLQKADYLTAVSGGSYIAASYALVSAESIPRPPGHPDVYAEGSPEEHFLKNHSAYLGPPGVAGKFWMVLRLLLGMSVNFAFLIAILYIVARPLGWLYGEYLHPSLRSRIPALNVEPWMWAVPVAIGALGLSLVLGDLLFYPIDRIARFLRAWSIRLIDAGAVLTIVFLVVPLLVKLLIGFKISFLPNLKVTLPSAGLLGMIVGAVRGFMAKNKSLMAYFAGAVIGPLALLGSFMIFVRGAARDGLSGSQFWWWAGISLAFLISYMCADLTSWSPHPFYERALWSAFGLHRVRTGAGPVAEVLPYDKNIQMSEIPPSPGVLPELVICAAANVSDAGMTPPGRNATWFTFSAHEIGGPMGTVPTRDFADMLGSRRRDISVAAAVAISGAAISPSMGKMTRGPLRLLMGLMNLRLGVWLPNPWWEQWNECWSRLHGQSRFRHLVFGRPRPRFLIKELMGWNHANSKFLYVTDGGHYENLGLVELIRRGCTTIYCLDASGDHEETFHTLGEAVALARTELQVEIDIHPDPMRPKDGLPASTDFVVGRIRYPNRVEGECVEGFLVYGKATVTQDAPWDVRDFGERDQRFPNHSTIDQFFNEQKFEAYRALGRSTARRMARWNDSESWPQPPKKEIRIEVETIRSRKPWWRF